MLTIKKTGAKVMMHLPCGEVKEGVRILVRRNLIKFTKQTVNKVGVLHNDWNLIEHLFKAHA